MVKNLEVNMITHTAQSRGHANHGWLESHHSFSFANYYDPKRMGFGALRVINDDRINGGMGFGMHPHRDMEIITIPLKGALEHKDSMGTSSVIRKGEVQIMSAGTGVFHSEYNASQNETVELLQIWVLPKKLNITPRYEQKAYDLAKLKNQIHFVVAPEEKGESVWINQDAYFALTDLDQDKEVTYTRQKEGNGIYVFVISGEVEFNGETFKARDGVGISDFKDLKIKAHKDSEVLLMEVPA